jgi:hypothetical protein
MDHDELSELCEYNCDGPDMGPVTVDYTQTTSESRHVFKRFGRAVRHQTWQAVCVFGYIAAANVGAARPEDMPDAMRPRRRS